MTDCAVARLLVALGADPDALDDQPDTPWLVTGVTGGADGRVAPRTNPTSPCATGSAVPRSSRRVSVGTSTTSDGSSARR